MPLPDIIGPDTDIDPQFWVRAAQGAIRRYCGWHVAPSITQKIRLSPRGGKSLELPTGHMTALDKCRVFDLDVTERVSWGQEGVLWLMCGRWPNLPGAVEVTFTHGYALEDVPDVASLIATVARRASSDPGVVASQSVNGAAVSYARGSGGAAISVPLMDTEKELLAPYRLAWGPAVA